MTLMLLASASSSRASEALQPQGRVSDYAQVLSAGERQRIEEKLARYEHDSSNQIWIAVFPALDGENLEDFTNRLFERWGVGRKDRNNGVLLAIFLRERRAKIEVGYGLEAVLTDALSRRIIERELGPRFREGDYAGGIEAASEALIRATRGEYKADRPKGRPSWLPILILALVILVPMFLSRLRSGATYGPAGRRRYSGGWHGGFGGWHGGHGRGGGGSTGGFGGGFSGGGGGLSGGGGASGSW